MARFDQKTIGAVLCLLSDTTKTDNQKSKESTQLFSEFSDYDHLELIWFVLLCYVCRNENGGVEILGGANYRANDEGISSAFSSPWGKEFKESIPKNMEGEVSLRIKENIKKMTKVIFLSMREGSNFMRNRNVAVFFSVSCSLLQYDL